MANKLIDMDLPTKAKRLDWAGDRYADLVVGTITNQQGYFVVSVISGWLDIPGLSEKEERQYKSFIKLFNKKLQS